MTDSGSCNMPGIKAAYEAGHAAALRRVQRYDEKLAAGMDEDDAAKNSEAEDSDNESDSNVDQEDQSSPMDEE